MAPGATSPTIPRPVVFAGQQAYVDYRLGMVAKVDALDTLNPSTAAGVCGLVEYDGFASDRLISRTDLPAVAQSADARLTLRFHPGARAHGGKDSRFVPVPPAAALERIRADLRGAITLTARATPGFDAVRRPPPSRRRVGRLPLRPSPRPPRRRLQRGLDDPHPSLPRLPLAGPRRRRPVGHPVDGGGDSRHARPPDPGERALRRRRQPRHRRVGPADAGMSARPPGHVPLSLTDRATGTRFGLRVERRKGGFTLLGAGDVPFAYDLGKAGRDDLLAFLEVYRGCCTPNVFAPLFLCRAGVGGILNGRGAIRYSLVIARVMEQVFGQPHPPNFLCGAAHVDDPLAAAREADGRPPAGLEPDAPRPGSSPSDPTTVRAEIAGVWRHDRR